MCNATGDNLDEHSCSVGACVSEPTPHCPYLEPIYLPNVCDAPATMPMLAVAVSATFDTDFDMNCTGGVVQQAGGAEICVVRYGSISVEADVELTVVGTRAVAFVSDDELLIAGILDVSATERTDGPGGGLIVSGTREGNVIGGGGAGFKTQGGAGGNASTDGGAANGGPPSPDPAAVPVLSGGSRPQGLDATANNSGGAGGAATLISCRGRVNVTGTIDSGGGGGARGFFLSIAAVGGAGGGSGGYVVLQGLDVVVTGEVFANGGGGGSGRPSNAQSGAHGQDAPRSMFGGAGGLTSGAGEGAGGSGGSITSGPTSGKRSTDPAASAGGGGGSMGFFQTYTPEGITPTLTPSSASPSFQAPLTLTTR